MLMIDRPCRTVQLLRQIAQIILWENSTTVDYWAQPLVVAGNVQDVRNQYSSCLKLDVDWPVC